MIGSCGIEVDRFNSLEGSFSRDFLFLLVCDAWVVVSVSVVYLLLEFELSFVSSVSVSVSVSDAGLFRSRDVG